MTISFGQLHIVPPLPPDGEEYKGAGILFDNLWDRGHMAESDLNCGSNEPTLAESELYDNESQSVLKIRHRYNIALGNNRIIVNPYEEPKFFGTVICRRLHDSLLSTNSLKLPPIRCKKCYFY